jgi:DNA-binding NarL/FixJ family response regulator
MTAPRLRTMLVDDHTLVRQGLRLILEGDPAFAVVAEAADGAQALELAAQQPLDLVILDISMPRLTGLQVLPSLTARHPELPVVVLSMHDNERFVLDALRGGARGYVLKSSVDRDLLAACRSAVAGGLMFQSTAARGMLTSLAAGGPTDDNPLSARETEVLKLIAEGHSTRAIADLLVISAKTVEGHRAKLAEKLGTSDRVALTRYAIRVGLIDA